MDLKVFPKSFWMILCPKGGTSPLTINSGVGGGALWLLKKGNSDEVIMIDSREEAPALVDPKIYKKKPHLSRIGAHSCAIPGVPSAIDYIHKNYGSLSLQECLSY